MDLYSIVLSNDVLKDMSEVVYYEKDFSFSTQPDGRKSKNSAKVESVPQIKSVCMGGAVIVQASVFPIRCKSKEERYFYSNHWGDFVVKPLGTSVVDRSSIPEIEIEKIEPPLKLKRPLQAKRKSLKPRKLKEDWMRYLKMAKLVTCPVYYITSRRVYKAQRNRTPVVPQPNTHVVESVLEAVLATTGTFRDIIVAIPENRRRYFIVQFLTSFGMLLNNIYSLSTRPAIPDMTAIALNITQLVSFYFEYCDLAGFNITRYAYMEESTVLKYIPYVHDYLYSQKGNLPQPNAIDLDPLLRSATLLVSFFVTMTTVQGAKPVDTISMLAKRIRDVKTIVNDARDFVTEMFEVISEILFGTKNATAAKLSLLTTEAAELNSMPYMQILRSGKQAALESLPERITTEIKNCNAHEKPTNAVRGLLQLLNVSFSQAVARLADFNTVTGNGFLPIKPDPVGVLFVGPKAVGKTHACQALRQIIAEELQYENRNWYQLNKPPGTKHHNTYLGEDIAYVEEFLFNPAKDSVLDSFNAIFSSTPYNVAGASIPEKRQFLQSKVVLMNTNKHKGVLTGMNADTTEAIWSRLLWIEMTDEKILNNPRFETVTHRKADFSHAKFLYRPPDGANKFKDEDAREVSFLELSSMIVKATALREIEFLEKLLADNTLKFIEIDKSWKINRIAFLKTVLQKPGPSCQTIKNRIPPMRAVVPIAEPNATTGRHFPVFRFQGPAGRGKTHFINKFASQVSNLTGIPMARVSSLKEFVQYRAIILIDDLQERFYQSDYINFINNTHSKSLILLATNDELLPFVPHSERLARSLSQVLPTWITRPLIRSESVKLEPSDLTGFPRRAGIGTSYFYKGVWHTIASPFSVTINTAPVIWEIITPEGPLMRTEKQIMDYCFDLYCHYLEQEEELPIVNSLPPSFEPDVEIQANTLRDLVNNLQSPSKIVSAAAFGGVAADGFCIKAKPHVFSALSSKIRTADFVLPNNLHEFPSFHEYIRPVVINMTRELLKNRPGTTARVKATDFEMGIYENVLYLPERTKTWSAYLADHFEETGYVVLREDSGPGIIEAPLQTIERILMGSEAIFTTGLSMSEISVLRQTFLDTYGIRPQYTRWFAQDILNRQPREKDISPALVAGVSIAALTSVFTIIWAIYKFASSSQDVVSKFIPNHRKFAASRMADEEYNEYKKALADFDRRDTRALGDYVGRFDEPAIDRAYIEYFGANALEVKTVDLYLRFKKALGNKDEMAALCKVYEDDHFMDFLIRRFDIHPEPNAIDKMPSISTPTPLAALARKTERNVVLVKIDSNGQTFVNHGIGLKENLVLTIAHSCWEEATDVCKIYFNIGETKYSSHCSLVWIDRIRDLALYRVLDKTVPAFVDLTKHLISSGEATTCKAAFKQYTKDGEMYMGTAVFDDYTTHKMQNSKTNFYFEKGQYMFDVPPYCPMRYMNKGDCGLPLFGYCGQEVKIIGIHVALGVMSNVFSAIDIDLLSPENIIQANTFVNEEMNGVQFISAFGEPLVVLDELHDCMQGTRVDGYFQDGIECRGSTRNAYTYYKPTDTPHKIKAGELKEVENTCDFAPQTEKTVEDKSELFYNKLAQEHSIFFTQMAKYGEQTRMAIKEDIFQFTASYLKFYYSQAYGECPFLSEGEAINGIQNRNSDLFGALKRMDMSTSAGFLFSKKFNISVKGEVFRNTASEEMPYYKIDETLEAGKFLRKSLDKRRNLFKRGILCASGAKACLKREILPISKCRKGGTRLFQACDLDSFVLRRMLYGTLMAKQAVNRFWSASQIGINPYKEFTGIRNRLDQVAGSPIFIDYKRFDKRAPLRIIKAYADCRFSLLPQEDQTRENRLLLVAEAVSMVRTIQVFQGSIFICNRGTMSGQADTCTQNDYINHFNIIYCLVSHLVSKGLKLEEIDNRQLYQAYQFFSLGDDGIIATNFLDFSFTDLKKHAAQLGFEVTDSGKGENSDNTFLSRTIERHEDGLVYPALKKSSIIRQLYFFKAYEPSLIAENLRNAMLEAGLWDQEFYSLIQSAVSSRLKTFSYSMQRKILGEKINFMTYSVIRRKWAAYIRGQGDVPDFTPPESDASEIIQPNCFKIASLNMFVLKNKNATTLVKEYYDANPCEERPCFKPVELQGFYRWEEIAKQFKVNDKEFTIVGRGPKVALALENANMTVLNLLVSAGKAVWEKASDKRAPSSICLSQCPNRFNPIDSYAEIPASVDEFNPAIDYMRETCPQMRAMPYRTLQLMHVKCDGFFHCRSSASTMRTAVTHHRMACIDRFDDDNCTFDEQVYYETCL